MPHCIDQITLPERGIVDMFAGNLIGGWHDLGKVEKVQTMQQLANNAGMVYKAEKRPAQFIGRNGTAVDIPNQFHIVRDIDERVISASTVTSTYVPYDYNEALPLLQVLVDQGYAQPETCMVLKDGQVEVMTIKWLRPDNVIEDPHSTFENYFVLANHHDKKGGVIGYPTSVRVVCMNTFLASLANGVQFKVKHVSKLNERVQEAMRLMATNSKAIALFNEQYVKMTKTNADIEALVNDLLGIEEGVEISTRLDNKRSAILAACNMPTKGTYGNTVADFFNGVTYDLSHNTGGKGAGSAVERFESRLLGSRGGVELDAWKLSLALVS